MKGSINTFVWIVVALCIVAAFGQQTGTSRATDPRTPQRASIAPADFDKQYAQIQELLTKMEDQMVKIRATQDRQERWRLLKEHWTTMQMATMTVHALWGGKKAGEVAGGHMMSGLLVQGDMISWNDYRNLTPEQLKERQYMMDRAIPVDQFIMDQILQHQYWVMQPQLPVPSKK